jgi:hypothetical protein
VRNAECCDTFVFAEAFMFLTWYVGKTVQEVTLYTAEMKETEQLITPHS